MDRFDGHEGAGRLTRFFVCPDQIRDGRVVIAGADVHHLRDVLRLGPGDSIQVLDGSNNEYVAVIESADPEGVVASIVDSRIRATEPRVHLTLAQCLPKGEKMEWVLQKGTEVGYSGFIPVASERSVVRLDAERAARKTERWNRVVREASEQAGRAVLPKVLPMLSWRELCGTFDGYDRVLLPWEGEETRGLRSALEGEPGRMLVIIGPEGGLTQGEVSVAEQAGAIPVSLGRRILRTETAGLVAAAAILFAAGEMG